MDTHAESLPYITEGLGHLDEKLLVIFTLFKGTRSTSPGSKILGERSAGLEIALLKNTRLESSRSVAVYTNFAARWHGPWSAGQNVR